MRRSTSYALIFLSLPLLAAAKPVIDNEGHAFLTDQILGGRSTGKSQQLRISSAQWGPRESGRGLDIARVDGEPVQSSATDLPKDLQAQDRMGDPASADGHSMLGASDRSGSTPGRYRTLHPRPLESGPGTLVVQGSFPACTVGQRYGGMQFASGGKTYRLRDVQVASCGGGTSMAPKEEITFFYNKVAY